jgi:hypothetical protein
LSVVCIIVAGVLRGTVPADTFTVAWQHSVEKTRWEEDYRVEGDRLVLTQSRVEGSGAGVDPPAGARLVNGRWQWRPDVPPLASLRLTSSTYTADYAICWSGRCESLRALARSTDVEVVTLTPCAG